ncbi:hypothetical protein CAT36_07535 [Acinetobacter pittii]|uniref:hypothetical protein n=1 Tax=Acinetobacter pittii TaxID=48296 RepID=UPI000A3AEE40|nr:hypothetical protein [Acinetobacter pittii]OTU51866.1 hypothetical protein CAT36_07535 [Acinetobacter pittii]
MSIPEITKDGTVRAWTEEDETKADNHTEMLIEKDASTLLWVVETCAHNIASLDILEAVCLTENKANEIAQEIENKKTNEFLSVSIRKVQADEFCGPFRSFKTN